MMVTANKIPVPEPIAPMKSANTVSAPIHIPPNAAAVGMYLFKVLTKDAFVVFHHEGVDYNIESIIFFRFGS